MMCLLFTVFAIQVVQSSSPNDDDKGKLQNRNCLCKPLKTFKNI